MPTPARAGDRIPVSLPPTLPLLILSKAAECLTFMMLDADIFAVAPSSTYRVLKAAGLIGRSKAKPSKKGTGFVQPLTPHEHWHVDFSYLNIGGVFYFLCAILDGCSRTIVAWDSRTTMREIDSEIVLQKAREAFPEAKPRIISDQGSQFKSREFKTFICQWQATHVMISPYYPHQTANSNASIKPLKIRPFALSLPLPSRTPSITGDFIGYYNDTRLHSAIGYVSPEARLEGPHPESYPVYCRAAEAEKLTLEAWLVQAANEKATRVMLRERWHLKDEF